MYKKIVADNSLGSAIKKIIARKFGIPLNEIAVIEEDGAEYFITKFEIYHSLGMAYIPNKPNKGDKTVFRQLDELLRGLESKDLLNDLAKLEDIENIFNEIREVFGSAGVADYRIRHWYYYFTKINSADCQANVCQGGLYDQWDFQESHVLPFKEKLEAGIDKVVLKTLNKIELEEIATKIKTIENEIMRIKKKALAKNIADLEAVFQG